MSLIGFEECFEMNFNGKCEEYDSCRECEEDYMETMAEKEK